MLKLRVPGNNCVDYTFGHPTLHLLIKTTYDKVHANILSEEKYQANRYLPKIIN